MAAAASSKTARLIMQLVDRVSGPARAIRGSLTALNTATKSVTGSSRTVGRTLGDSGRRLRRFSYDAGGIGAPLSIGAAAAARSVYDFEKAGNKMQAFGLLTKNQREELEKYAQVLNKDFPFTNRQIIEAAQELFRAGLTYEQAMGALRGTLNLALAGDLPVKDATDIATNVMTAMKLPMETFDQVQASLLRVNDAITWAATSSNTDVRLMGDTFRYVAPLAAAAGMSLEQVTAMAAELARNGIKGAEAGVAMRSALVRLAKPTKPMLAALERLGLSMRDFVTYKKEIAASDILGTLRASGINADEVAGEIQAILNDKSLANAPARMAANITDTIVEAIGDEAIRSEVATAVSDAVYIGAQKVDLFKLLQAITDKGGTITDIVSIFDVRMGSRLASVLGADLAAMTERLEAEAPGIGVRMAELMMQGIVGTWARFLAALENLFITIANSGVLDAISNVIEKITGLLNHLSELSPQVLKLGTYGILAAGALAPLGLALGGVASAVGAIVSPLGLVIAGLGTLAAFKWDELNAGMAGLSKGFSENLSPETLERFNAASDKYKKFIDWLTTSKPGDSDKARSGGAAVGKFHADMANFHSDNLNKIEKEWLPAIDRVLKKIGSGWRDLDTFFSKPIGSELFESMIGGFSNVTAKIDDFMSRPVATEMFDSVVAGFSKIGTDLTDFLSTPMELDFGDFDALSKKISDFTGDGVSQISQFAADISRHLDDIPAFVSFKASLDALTARIGGFTGKATAAFSKMISTIQGHWERLDAFLARSIGKEMFDRLKAEFDAVKEKVGAVVDTVVGKVQTAQDRLKSALDKVTAFFTGLPVKFKNAASGIGTFATDSLAAIRKFVTDIVEALKALPGQLYQVGVDAIQQLLEGMKAKAMELVNWASSLGSRVGASIRSGISSIGGLVFGGGEAPAPPAASGTAGSTGASAPRVAPPVGPAAPPTRRGRRRRRAAGGPVRAGMTYEIGERGKEEFTPGKSGYVTPNHKIAGRTMNQENHFHITGSNPDEIARAIGRELRGMLQDSRQTSLEGGPVYG